MKKNILKKINNGLTEKIYNYIPSPIISSFLRKNIKLQSKDGLESKIILKVATQKEELEDAFHLSYLTYNEKNLIKKNKEELRVTPYNSLPSTSVILAKLDNKVIGAISVYRSNSFGIPISKIHDLTQLDQEGVKYGEISYCAIDPNFQKNKEIITLLLLKYVYDYSLHYFGIDVLFITIRPDDRFYYESVLLFSPYENRIVKKYQFGNGADVIIEFLNLKEAPSIFSHIYGKLNSSNNLFHFFFKKEHSSFQFPKRDFNKISDPVMTPNLLDYFFNFKFPILKNLDVYEISILKNIYHTKEYSLIFKNAQLDQHEIPYSFQRIEPRLETNCTAVLYFDRNSFFTLKVYDVSMNGLMVYTKENILMNKSYIIKVEIETHIFAELEITPKWSNKEGYVGMLITKKDAQWNHFIQHLSNDLFKNIQVS